MILALLFFSVALLVGAWAASKVEDELKESIPYVSAVVIVGSLFALGALIWDVTIWFRLLILLVGGLLLWRFPSVFLALLGVASALVAQPLFLGLLLAALWCYAILLVAEHPKKVPLILALKSLPIYLVPALVAMIF